MSPVTVFAAAVPGIPAPSAAGHPGRQVVPGGRVHSGPPRVEPVRRVVPRMRLAGSRADLATV
jgi:hypothetical protein